MATAPAGSRSDLPTDEELLSLLAYLRGDGLPLVPQQFAAALGVLRRARLTWPRRAPRIRLAYALTPVLAKTPEQQQLLYKSFERMGFEGGPHVDLDGRLGSTGGGDASAAPALRLSVWPILLILFLVAAAGMLIFQGGLVGGSAAAPVEGPNPSETGIAAVTSTSGSGLRWLLMGAIAGVGLLLALGILHWARARAVARLAEGPPSLEIGHRPFGISLFDRPAVATTAQRLRRFQPVATRNLDEARTIERTIKEGGFFAPVYRSRPLSPRYLFLVEEKSRQDHVARLADTLLDRLETEGVAIDRYYFDGDLRRLRSRAGGKDRWIEVDQLLAPEGSTLAIVGDGVGLFGAGDQLKPDLAALFERFSRRVLFSTLPIGAWSRRELVLSESGYVVATARESGFCAFAGLAATGPSGRGALLEAALVSRGEARRLTQDRPSRPSEEQLRLAFEAVLAAFPGESPEGPPEMDDVVESIRKFLATGDLRSAVERANSYAPTRRLRIAAPRLFEAIDACLGRDPRGGWSTPPPVGEAAPSSRWGPDDPQAMDFVEPAILPELLATLVDSKSAPTVVLIGTWGSGKTTLGRLVARRLEPDWQVAWISLWDSSPSDNLLKTLAERLDLPVPSEEGTAERQERQLADQIARIKDRRLIVIDDIDRAAPFYRAPLAVLTASLALARRSGVRLLLLCDTDPLPEAPAREVSRLILHEGAVREGLLRLIERQMGSDAAAELKDDTVAELRQFIKRMQTHRA